MRGRSRGRGVRGFTLVELLVVIGVIAVLISMLLPALQAARRQANTAKCLAVMRQWGAIFQMYAYDNNGYWPLTRHTWTENGVPRDKRWHDFLGKYANNGRLVNWDGSARPSNPPHQPNSLGTVQDTIESLRDSVNILRGCPAYFPDRIINYSVSTTPGQYTLPATSAQGSFPGFTMNLYCFAPKPVNSSNLVNGFLPWAKRSNSATIGYPSQPGFNPAADGWYFRANQWTRPTERALLFDSNHPLCSVTPTAPWWTAFGWSYMPPVPDAASFTIDFNRHGRRQIGTPYKEKSLNMLFVDGHAATVSCKEAHYAIRFPAGLND